MAKKKGKAWEHLSCDIDTRWMRGWGGGGGGGGGGGVPMLTTNSYTISHRASFLQ